MERETIIRCQLGNNVLGLTIRVPSLVLACFILSLTTGYSAKKKNNVGTFGPTGLLVHITADRSLLVTSVLKDSPASGKIAVGEIISSINDKPVLLPQKDDRLFGDFKRLASFITETEATDGILSCKLLPNADQEERVVTIRIPVLGKYDEGSLEGDKAELVIRQNADAIRKSFIWKKPVGSQWS